MNSRSLSFFNETIGYQRTLEIRKTMPRTKPKNPKVIDKSDRTKYFKNGKEKRGRLKYKRRPKSKSVVVNGIVMDRMKIESDPEEIARYKWKADFYYLAYEGARDGMSAKEIAKLIGVSAMTLASWRVAKPALNRAIERGKELAIGKGDNFRDYVYRQLPEELRELWDSIDACQNKANAVERIETILAKKGTAVRQHLFLHALTTTNFDVNKALKAVNVSKDVFDRWCRQDVEFVRLWESIQWHKKNFFESALMKLINKGETSAVLFANRTINKDRGYSDKQVIEHQHQHDHIHKHAVVQVEDLNLPLDVRKVLLQAIREQSKEVDGYLDGPKSQIETDEIVVEASEVQRVKANR